MIFIYVANVVAITRRYYKLFTKNLDIIRFAFYSGGQLEEFFKFDKRCSFMLAIISAKRRLVMRI